jgi:hypothetical protein
VNSPGIGFDAFYCIPGVEGAHEKGGVEGEIGRFRRTHLSPVPVVDSLAELNDLIEEADHADDGRRITGRARTVREDFAVEQPLLADLPVEGFETGQWLQPRVDRFSRVTVRCCLYSVPARLIGRQVRVLLRASEVIVFDGRAEVARHARSVMKGAQTLLLVHYLEVFTRKPGALPGATALAQARDHGTFTAAHDAFWAAARQAHGDAGGTRALIEVLLLQRHLPHPAVIAGIEASLRVGAVTADIVAVEARKHAHRQPSRPALPGDGERSAQVVSLTERRLADPAAVIGGLPSEPRPLPGRRALRRAAHAARPPGRPAHREVS